MRHRLQVIAIAIVLIIVIIILYYKHRPASPVIVKSSLITTANTWQDMSPNEKLDYLVIRYLGTDAKSSSNPKVIEQNKYIASLPQDSNCLDNYDKCPTWAANSECDINPEYMLYNCKKSCKSCSLNPQQLYDVTRIINSRAPPSCSYRGESYPGPLNYYLHLLQYQS